MVALTSTDCELFEKSFLEWLRTYLERTQKDDRAGACRRLGSLIELVGVVGPEVATLPICIEDGSHFVDHVGVAGSGDTNVPFETRHLSGVGEIGRSNVGGREPRVALEQPGFCVQPSRACVIGHPDISPESVEEVKSLALGRSGVSGGQDPQLTSPVAMLAQRRTQWGQTGVADESHQHVDPVSRANLGLYLAPDSWLARGVGEQRGVEEGDEWGLDGRSRAVGLTFEDRSQNRSRLDRSIGFGVGGFDQLAEPIQEVSGDLDSQSYPLSFFQRVYGPFDATAEVQGQSVGGLRLVEIGAADDQPVLQLVQPGFKPGCDQHFVESAVERLGHAGFREGVVKDKGFGTLMEGLSSPAGLAAVETERDSSAVIAERPREMPGVSLSNFDRYIGIDYSGAETPTSSLKGLRVYTADRASSPVEVPPPPSPRKYWTRRGITEWLELRILEDRRALVGIDHAFSFPMRYFEVHHLPPHWRAFLDDFQRHWPTDGDNTYVDFVRDGSRGAGAARSGSARWRRLTDERAGAKSVFHFDVPGSVAKSTHAGLPWLRYLSNRLGNRVHFWPFDGWKIAKSRSAVLEVYPTLWRGGYGREGRTPDQHDAYSVAAWMSGADLDGSLAGFLNPSLSPAEKAEAQVEGWILGIK